MSGGGFTLVSECVYLHKPVLSTPIRGQFEQILNALYLEKLGYGRYAPEVTPEVLRDFLDGVPGFSERLATYTQVENRELLAALDGLLDRALAGL